MIRTYSQYLANIMDDSLITCDEIIKSDNKETKTVPKYFNVKKVASKTKISTFYLLFYKLL